MANPEEVLNSFLQKKPEDTLDSFLTSKPEDVLNNFLSKESSQIQTEDRSFLPKPKSNVDEAIQQAAIGLVNSVGFGIPKYLTEKAGFDVPDPETPLGAVGRGVGDLAGFIGLPARAGGKIAEHLLAPAFEAVLKNPTKLKQAGLILSQNAIGLGVASGLMTPEEGFFAPTERLKQFGSGAVTGAAFGGLSFVPSPVLRMSIGAGITGVPSTFRHEPLEMQIFNYGLGAFFGRKGLDLKKQTDQLKQMSELIKNGVDGEHLINVENKIRNDLGILKQTVGLKPEPLTDKQKLNKLVGDNESTKFVFDEHGNYNLMSFKMNKDLRATAENRIMKMIRSDKKDPYGALRNDDIDWIKSRVVNKKDLNQFNDKEIEAIKTILDNKPQPPSPTEFAPGIPKPLNIYDLIMRPMYPVFEKMGLGNYLNSGLTREHHTSEIAARDFMNQSTEILNNIKRMTGLNKKNTEPIFYYLEGQITRSSLIQKTSEKHAKAADYLREYLDLSLDSANRQRTMFNQAPIERRNNYITHVYERMLADVEKSNIPIEVENMMASFVPKAKNLRFGRARVSGRTDYKKDLYEVIDTYSKAVSYSANDSFVRKAYKYTDFLKKEMKLHQNNEQEYNYDVKSVIRNLENFIKETSGRPLKWDKEIAHSMSGFNKILDNLGFGKYQIKHINQVSNFLSSMTYSTQMAFRPKLAIRNLGQQSLVIAQEGFRNTFEAIKAKPTKENLEAMSKSEVLKGRAMAFTPEPVADFLRSGMWMFQKADLKNVKTAFLAGYIGAKKRGLSEVQAIKRGDEVAGLTQFIYLSGNRSGLARGLGLSTTLRPLSIFTTWPSNYMEFIVASAAPEHRANLLKYIAFSTGFIAVSSFAGIKGISYTGLDSPLSLLQWVTNPSKLPIAGIAERGITIQLLNDVKKALRDEDLRQLLLYTFSEDPENILDYIK